MVTSGPLQNALLLRSDPLSFFSALANGGEKISTIELPAGPAHVVHEPELIAQLLLDRTGTIQKHLLAGVPQTFGGGLFTSSGSRHSTVRQLAQPAFHRAEIEGRANEVRSIVSHALEELHEGEQDLQRFFDQTTLIIVGRVLFGLDLAAMAQDFFDRAELMQRTFLQIEVSPDAAECFDNASRTIDELLHDAVGRQRSGRGDNLLSTLEAAGAFTKQEIVEEIRSFLLASIPTSLLLATACWLLSSHEDEQIRLRESNDGSWSENVVHETLRLYPPAWLLIREALEEFKYDGKSYPAGSVFFVCPWTIHRSPRYFSEPEQFQPERWARKRDLPRGAYIPFSLGPRSCIGERLGRLIAQETLRPVVARYRLLPSTRQQGAWFPRITLAPRGGIWVRLQTHGSS